jgi:hypothetical protein
MEPAADVDGAAKASPLWAKYGTRLERETASEALAERIERAAEAEAPKTPSRKKPARPKEPTSGDPLTDFLGSRQGRALQREIVRGVFGMLRKRL